MRVTKGNFRVIVLIGNWYSLKEKVDYYPDRATGGRVCVRVHAGQPQAEDPKGRTVWEVQKLRQVRDEEKMSESQARAAGEPGICRRGIFISSDKEAACWSWQSAAGRGSRRVR